MRYLFNVIDDTCVTDFGGKSFWLNWLSKNGYSIPKTYFLKACESCSIQNILNDETFNQELLLLEKQITNFAIRSSGLAEDGIKESKAGIYDSFLNVSGIENIKRAVNDVITNSNEKMGVVIQEMITPLYSGVIFSTNPMNGNRNEINISYVKGEGSKLVSGEVKSIDISCKIINNEIILEDSNIKEVLLQLVKYSKEIENKLNIAVDIEWCINDKNELILLQCRPVTTILFNGSNFFKINKKNLENIPNKYVTSDKVKIRTLAEESNIMISDAYVLVTDCLEDKLDTSIINITKSKYYRGYSVVVIYPNKIDGKIMRSFTGDKSNAKNQITCHRYTIRSIADYTSLIECVEGFYDTIKKDYFSCAIIIQELFDPEFTGIAKKTKDGFLIEILKGHFASKGVTPMSRYVLNKNFEVISKKEVKQDAYISFAEGIKVEFDIDETLVTINDETAKNIALVFNDIMDESVVLEFGLLNDNNSLIPYFIDYTFETTTEIDQDNFNKGIISSGEITGKVINLDMGDITKTLDVHFHDDIDTSKSSDEKIIFVAELPSIQFVDIINNYNHKNIGFIFKDGSVLCHLSVLLRENSIPAIFSDKKYNDNCIININTSKGNIVNEM